MHLCAHFRILALDRAQPSIRKTLDFKCVCVCVCMCVCARACVRVLRILASNCAQLSECEHITNLFTMI